MLVAVQCSLSKLRTSEAVSLTLEFADPRGPARAVISKPRWESREVFIVGTTLIRQFREWRFTLRFWSFSALLKMSTTVKILVEAARAGIHCVVSSVTLLIVSYLLFQSCEFISSDSVNSCSNSGGSLVSISLNREPDFRIPLALLSFESLDLPVKLWPRLVTSALLKVRLVDGESIVLSLSNIDLSLLIVASFNLRFSSLSKSLGISS
mmetsp:Transcript_34183/g.59791  ORF Transcript_34183/g.59791 Transcript_34183/m.59791 type:complete len:209 (-) Transcript_34183:3244-3870(-)